MKLLNAFTPAMLDLSHEMGVTFSPISEASARAIATGGKDQPFGALESCVGHQASAELYAAKLGVEVPVNRVSVTLARGEYALLGQYVGPRLPEGRVLTREELEAAGIQWLLVRVQWCTQSDQQR